VNRRIELVKILHYGCMPTQWECRAADGRQVYVRYRNGCLSCSVSNEPSDDPDDAVLEATSTNLFDQKVGNSGYMQTYEMLQHLVGVLEFTPTCEVASYWNDIYQETFPPVCKGAQ